MAVEEINFDGLTVSQLYQTFTAGGISPSDASVLVSSWIYENVGRTNRVFNYVQPFPAVEPSCQPPPFVRTFQHDDWVDGEDVVQAGTTTGEVGFNERFHRIEADLDTLGANVAKAFTCLAAMRAGLRNLLDEIRAEINRLHDTTHEWQIVAPNLGLTVDKFPNYHFGMLDFGKYMGTTTFLDQNVSVWSTKNGTVVLPAVETLGVDVIVGPKLKNAALINRFIAENPEVRQRFPKEFIIDDFLREYGGEEIADGRTVRDVLKVLPIRTQFLTLDAMVLETGEREAAIVRTTMGAQSAISAALGIEGDLETVGDADVTKLNSVPTKARAALAKAGIATVGALADVSPSQVLEIMNEAGVRAGPGEAAEWTSFAQTLTRLR